MKIKRYLLFTYYHYDADGGVKDFVDSFDEFEQLAKYVNDNINTDVIKECVNVLDINTGISYVCDEIPFRLKELDKDSGICYSLK